MYGTEPRFNEILVKKNTIHNRKRKTYLHITNEYQHVIKDECQTDEQKIYKIYLYSTFKQICLPVLEFLVP